MLGQFLMSAHLTAVTPTRLFLSVCVHTRVCTVLGGDDETHWHFYPLWHRTNILISLLYLSHCKLAPFGPVSPTWAAQEMPLTSADFIDDLSHPFHRKPRLQLTTPVIKLLVKPSIWSKTHPVCIFKGFCTKQAVVFHFRKWVILCQINHILKNFMAENVDFVNIFLKKDK